MSNRTKLLQVWVTPALHNQLWKEANGVGVSLSELMRSKLETSEPKLTVDRVRAILDGIVREEVRAELARARSGEVK